MARHAFGDLYRSCEFRFPGAGRLKLTYLPDDGGAPIEKELTRTDGAGVALAMYNLIRRGGLDGTPDAAGEDCQLRRVDLKFTVH